MEVKQTAMADEQLKLEAIRMQLGLSRKQMADRMHISLDRYNRLANGESKLLATEFIEIHRLSGLDYERIAATQ
jgi:transcriptional regulator with XRE-family HTH domain